ncbi:hypothetical protein CGCSCA5_v001873 [Colletotrichum siamense]|nr:hypothetical protein CGCSCA5_v001873 [Colletotrichum siamense]
MVFIGSEVIGQSKWLWMEKPRPLRDMERFDNAARGAWGSLKLFFYSWKPTMTLIGAFIVITSYAIGPFAQQATTSYSCNITGEGYGD